MKAVEKLINGKEIDLEELEGRADQAQIQKVCELDLPDLFLFITFILLVALDDQLIIFW